MKEPKNFSVVIATYTGVDTIDVTLTSLLEQKNTGAKYEIIVVIDGPNEKLRVKIEGVRKAFEVKNIPFKIKQFRRNKGRFEARLAGAKLAKNGYILIVDDRIVLPSNFLKHLTSINEEAIMPDVQEKAANNFVSLTLNRLRRKLYGSKWNTEFKPYYIDGDNFDNSPKGTTALWVNRRIFIDACEQIVNTTVSTKYLNDDTRILRYLVDNGTRLYKTSKLRIIYEPRSEPRDELIHIYHRGPRFIDYYLRPGSRYFLPLLAFYLSLAPLIGVIVIWPWLLLIILVGLILLSSFLSENPRRIPIITAGLLSIFLFFGAGLIVGLVREGIGK